MAGAAALMGLMLATTAAPSDDASLLREAEQAFRAGVAAAGTPGEAAAFRTAAERYDELRKNGHQNPALFLNQGNAYLLANELPQAILAYRRGLRLAPGDRSLQAALAYARGQVLYPASESFARPPSENWPPALPRPSLRMLLAVAGFFYFLACLGFARWYMVRRRQALTFAAIALVLALIPLAGALYESQQRRDAVEHPLVVIAEDDVILRGGDGHSFPRRSDLPLNRGIEARLLFQRSRWLQVELSGGEVGWVPRSVALVDRAE
jgi:hypothetical protein